MSEYTQFQNASALKAADEPHRLKILKAVTTHEEQVSAMIASQLRATKQLRSGIMR
jgi:hypothetical protein